jgi:hypothetical protein
MSRPRGRPKGKAQARAARRDPLAPPSKAELLAGMRAQIEEGTLIIRHMSDEETKAHRYHQDARLSGPALPTFT